MQAITTKYLPPTNNRGARIKAECSRGSLILPIDHSLDADKNHEMAREKLINKFVSEDGTTTNPWNGTWVMGTTKNGQTVHVNCSE